MNTSALKSFAPAVRRQLMDAVERKLDYVLTADTPDLRQAANQVELLRKEAARDRKGLIERVSYTWFNRIAALRFLDARDWHPFRARVITAATPEELQPEILKLLRTGSFPEELHSHTDLKRLNDLLDGRLPTAIAGADPQGEVYRELVLTACRFYHATLPFLFERVDDESELLLPDDLLTANSVIEGFRTQISDEDCSEVEVLGWLYQFYISEKKDAVMARKSAVPTEDIPAVTQLFTPHWIVRYLVENSLGRLWMLNHPTSKLREEMPYYIEGEAETDFLKIGKPEEIKLVDPAVGSGHMLTYAFDLLVKIYEEEGYAPSEIPEKILTHNLYGLEICPRAAQLAQFALVCKAREISRSAFRSPIQPQVICLQDISFEENELKEYIDALKLGSLFSHPVLKLMHQFEQSTNFGSLIQPCLDEKAIAELLAAIEGKELGSQLFLRETHRKVIRVLKQAEALTQRYHVVAANPPYMGKGQMNGSFKSFATNHYINSKSDAFAMFIERGFTFVLRMGFSAMVTMESWMFLSSYLQLRAKILNKSTILAMVHMPYLGKGGTSMGINFGTSATIFVNSSQPTYQGSFQCIRYYECNDFGVPLHFPTINERYGRVSVSGLMKVDGYPIAYWLSEGLLAAFSEGERFDTIGNPRVGMQTANNERFLRLWHEIEVSKSNIVGTSKRWVKYLKGGPFRKWWGNNDFVLYYAEDASLLRQQENASIQPIEMLDRLKCSWTDISSTSQFGARLAPLGCFYDIKGHCFLPNHSDVHQLLALSNSKPFNQFLNILNPGLNFQVGDVARVPLPRNWMTIPQSDITECLSIARSDWDNFETSWDFSENPLLCLKLKSDSLLESWCKWEKHCLSAIARMRELETENNRLFIEAYGLQDELSPEVPEDQITLARADRRKDVVAFLSYAVGCMMGRYSLEMPGLILADAGDTVDEYLKKVKMPLDQLSFPPDEDGIIPVVEGEWFPDDIVARTREFLRVTFGESTLNENLRFIEESLGKSLEKYFLNDFYKDHISNERAYGYKKRPIYWLFQSPKKGFSALVYLHRYTKDTCNTLLNGYLREYIKKIDAKIAHLEHVSATADSAREKTAAAKELEKLRKVLKECQDWERDVLLPLAQRRLEIDLDDGVKVNYLKFGNALATIPGLASKEEE